MQVDAHVDFQRGFDRQLLKMWAMTENEYGVLSTYVGNAKQDLNTEGEVVIGHPRYTVPVICSVIRGGNNAVRNHQAGGATCLSKPALSLTWAAGWPVVFSCRF